jgi:peptidyl-tRNA hydrolase, PTH1 family
MACAAGSGPESSPDPAMIVGLGNPGAAYEGTRHNLGFMIADEIARTLRVPFRIVPGGFEYARFKGADGAVHIVKPLTFMNLSGEAVRTALAMTGTALDRTLIVLDDFQLPLGLIRIRPAGSDGGHRGLGSVIASLETEAVPRLRCGIGPEALPAKEERREFVLSRFTQGEEGTVREMILRAAGASREFAQSGIHRAMTVYNTQ